MTAHTPGPWAFLEAEDDLADRIGPWTIGGPKLDDIAEVYSDENATVGIVRDEAIANARLIAAAPDLLEALQEAADIMAEMQSGADAGGASTSWFSDVERKCCTAIAKALDGQGE